MIDMTYEELTRSVDQLKYHIGTSSFQSKLSFIFSKVLELQKEDSAKAIPLHDQLRVYSFEHDKATKERTRGSSKVLLDFEVSRNREEYMTKVILENNNIADVLSALVLCNKFLEVFNPAIIKKGVVQKAAEMYKEKIRYGSNPSVAQDNCEAFINSLEDHQLCTQYELLDAIVAFRISAGIQIEQGPFGVDKRVTSEMKTSIIAKQSAYSERTAEEERIKNEIIIKFSEIVNIYKTVIIQLDDALANGKYNIINKLISAALVEDIVVITREDVLNLNLHFNEAVEYLDRLEKMKEFEKEFSTAVSELNLGEIQRICKDLREYVLHLVNYCSNVVNKKYLGGTVL